MFRLDSFFKNKFWFVALIKIYIVPIAPFLISKLKEYPMYYVTKIPTPIWCRISSPQTEMLSHQPFPSGFTNVRLKNAGEPTTNDKSVAIWRSYCISYFWIPVHYLLSMRRWINALKFIVNKIKNRINTYLLRAFCYIWFIIIDWWLE